MAYRAFFALPTDLATASGQVTNAVYGFTSMLINLLKDHKPDGIAVAFDRPERTFRHDLVDDYKAGRAAAPDILRQQMGLVRQVVETLKIPIVEIAGFEADDVIATLATQARDRGDDVIVVTGDRDAYQLVEDPHVKVLYNRRGVSDYVLYDEAGILERTGVTPVMYPQYAALRGDPSDNLPGVPGVGEKTAAKLLNTYGDLDGVFANIDKCTPKLRENLAAHEPVVRRNATATPLVRDVDLGVDLSDLRMGAFDARRGAGAVQLPRVQHPPPPAAGGHRHGRGGGRGRGHGRGRRQPLEVDVRPGGHGRRGGGRPPGARAGQPRRLLGRARRAGAGRRAWRWRPTGATARPPGSRPTCSTSRRCGTCWRPCPSGPTTPRPCSGALELDLRGLDIDTAIAAYLIDPAESQYLLDDLAARFLGLEVRSPDAPPPGQLDLSGTAVDPAEEAGRRAVAVGLLVPALAQSLDARGLRRLYDDVERPLVRVLARMEAAGVRVDVDLLRGIYDGLVAEGARLEEEIQEIAGERFLVNSTLQLRRVLFDKLGLQPQKKTKTGFSTDAASLEKLRGLHPIIEPLLRYREVEKLRSTYGESPAGRGRSRRAHPRHLQPDGGPHRPAQLRPAQPPQHPHPHRGGPAHPPGVPPRRGVPVPRGRLQPDRAAGDRPPGPGPGPDRGLRHRPGHPQGHRRPPVLGRPRRRSRSASGRRPRWSPTGWPTGWSRSAWASGWASPPRRRPLILGAYFEAFPSVRAYMERTVVEARDRGYTETLFGRRRQIPELQSQNYRLRQAGERQAMNAGIQGLAADIFKVALVRLDRALEDQGLAARLVLQVHDEVILEVPPDRGGRGRRRHPRSHARRRRAERPPRGQPGLGRHLGHRQRIASESRQSSGQERGGCRTFHAQGRQRTVGVGARSVHSAGRRSRRGPSRWSG